MRLVATGALGLALVTAGCGSHTQKLARSDAAPLIALARRIAAEGPCAQKRDLAAVRTKAIALVNSKAVPAELQEPFLAGVNDLAGRTPDCVPPPAPPPQHDHGKGHGKHKHGEEGD